MKQTKITIPTPCHESWEQMTPAGEGRHCASCDKVVVDFTRMSLEELQAYFENHSFQKSCGHFRNDQIEVPVPFLHKKLIDFHAYLEHHISKRSLRIVALSFVLFCMTMVGCKTKKYTQSSHTSGRYLYTKKTELPASHQSNKTFQK
ncbi:MAG TPA: hypothetical protein VFF27_13520 [Bacteroidia bacterium]|jgi:hypothetical protein|nr:hypothetical protein [Bacteroidia bacterium]